MAKKKESFGDQPPVEKQEAAGQSVTIELRRDCRVGDATCDKGHVLGQVTLSPGTSLNFLVDAIRNGLAGEQFPPPPAEA